MPGNATPTDINAKGWIAVLKRVKAEMDDDHVGLIAAGCAFYGLLAIFPAIVAAMAIAGLVMDTSQVIDQLRSLAQVIPQEASQIVLDQAVAVTGSNEGGLGLAAIGGICVALYSATKGMQALIEGLNVTFDVPESRPFFRLLLWKVVLTFGMIAGFLIVVIALIGVPLLLEFFWLDPESALWLNLIRWPVLLVMMALGLAVLYRYGPNRRRRAWRWVTPGAIVACLLWLAGSAGFGAYVTHFGSYNETFGALGGVIVLLMWLWLSSYIILVGAELDSEIEAQAKQNPAPATSAAGSADSDRLDPPAPHVTKQDTAAKTGRQANAPISAMLGFALGAMLAGRERKEPKDTK